MVRKTVFNALCVVYELSYIFITLRGCLSMLSLAAIEIWTQQTTIGQWAWGETPGTALILHR